MTAQTIERIEPARTAFLLMDYQRGIIDQLADRALVRIQHIDQVVDLSQDDVQLLDRALAGLDNVGEVWRLRRLQLPVVLNRGPAGRLATDVHNRIAQNADRLQA